jgi:hypothetical protein
VDREEVRYIFTESDLERFSDFVYPCPMSGCHIWGGSSNPAGYGLFRLGRQGDMMPLSKRYPLVLSSRAAWLISGRKLFVGDCILHKCDVPSCMNVDHLFVGSQQDNTADRVLKERGNFSGNFPYGVVSAPGGKYYGKVVFNNKQIHCGTHATVVDAHRAAIEKKSCLYGRRFEFEI